jgi:hypothetical protein
LEIAAKTGAEWKLLPEEEKKKYEEEAKRLVDEHKRIAAEYESKFITPFKRVNYANLGLKKLFEGVKNLQIA